MRTALFFAIACGSSDPAHPSPAPAEPAPATAPSPAPAPAAPASAAPTSAAPAGPGDAARGEAVYTQYCTACHQADGTGMNGMLAANFVADKTRLAKPDEELLAVIKNGVTGKVGTMPPWGATLTEQQQLDVLAYVRKKFGGS